MVGLAFTLTKCTCYQNDFERYALVGTTIPSFSEWWTTSHAGIACLPAHRGAGLAQKYQPPVWVGDAQCTAVKHLQVYQSSSLGL